MARTPCSSSTSAAPYCGPSSFGTCLGVVKSGCRTFRRCSRGAFAWGSCNLLPRSRNCVLLLCLDDDHHVLAGAFYGASDTYRDKRFFVIVLASTCTFSVFYGAASPLSREDNAAFLAFNALFARLLMAVVIALYEWVAERAEKDLIESRWRTQVASETLENVSRQLAK